ncbi:alpha/beta hydrolase [Agromyces protaetiae]|uniref:Alpha/beta hydrolase n=1 Tax=Agromyces protaetiae TaxID=2509455 RepID=A0A4P6FF78_9MICO|nr:alpha/beta hydrolase [Agromyces protaetiae]QAY73049.1 alpha/beta hydrolase [Agromyces protaetiae]
MDVILIPGFWLDASSWARVTPVLDETGHHIRPITLPGLESRDADRSGIGLADWIRAVVDLVDESEGPVVLVGHSGGGTVAHGVVDARPDRIAKVVYVDAGPSGDGEPINAELPVVGDEVPLPDWSVFEDADLVDLDPALRAEFERVAIPIPAAVASDPLKLADERRYAVPVTIIACEFPSQVLVEAIAAGQPWIGELARIEHVDYVDLPTGHWPQFTKPTQLGQAIAAALPVV